MNIGFRACSQILRTNENTPINDLIEDFYMIR